MECNELISKNWDGIKEYLCNDVSLARLINIDGGTKMLSVDVATPWNMPIDNTLRVGDIQLIYRREVINDSIWEFVGYDDGSRRELISIRIFLNTSADESKIKELIMRVLRTYSGSP
ncbi:MAG: hypothetical protein TU36_006615 [Vulcanisaeta sp. AZ3]